MIKFKKDLSSKTYLSDGCILWEGKPWHKSYVTVRVEGKLTKAHIASYRLHNGGIPAGMVIRHTCDNKRYVNPNHLLLGTRKENTHDMLERHPRFEQYRRKLREM